VNTVNYCSRLEHISSDNTYMVTNANRVSVGYSGYICMYIYIHIVWKTASTVYWLGKKDLGKKE
jgi:hypothetical protein